MLKLAMIASTALAFLFYLPGDVPNSTIRFRNVTPASGIHALMRCGSPEKRWIPEANGSGAAWLDYDNDGRMDLVIVNGSNMADLRQIVAGQTPPARPGSLYLFHNLGNGRFEDVTARAGLKNAYWGTGANAVDYNNDGFTDIFVTGIGLDLLFRNNGDGTFTEVGKEAGISRQVAWHTGSAFGDYDNDGNLDLFVSGYIDIKNLLAGGLDPPVCNYRGVMGFCGPKGLRGEKDILYHSNGNGTFSEVSEQAGVSDTERRHGFTAVFDDFNGDGRVDLLVANDSDPNYLFINQGNGRFCDRALDAGLGFNGDGETQANMGVAVGDYDGDGLNDVLITTFSQDYFPVFRQNRPGFFEDVSADVGLRNVTGSWLGWACGFADLDNDSHRDLWIANGHVYPQIDHAGISSYHEPVSVFQNRQAKFFLQTAAVPSQLENSYRGGCAGDFDNDGRVDLVVLPVDGSPVLLANRSEPTGNWIGFHLRGHKSNRDAIGAKIIIQACGNKQADSVRNGGSYLSGNDPRVHFGLINCPRADEVSITWPSGIRQRLTHLNAGRYLTIDEPRESSITPK